MKNILCQTQSGFLRVIQTLSLSLCGWNYTVRVREPRISWATCSRSKNYMSRCWLWIVKRDFISVNSTHSFPWRAASSPPWPCLVYCLPRSSCGTSNRENMRRLLYRPASMFINATHSSFLCAKSTTYPASEDGLIHYIISATEDKVYFCFFVGKLNINDLNLWNNLYVCVILPHKGTVLCTQLLFTWVISTEILEMLGAAEDIKVQR